MRIAEYKQIDVRQEERTHIIPATFDDDGNVLTEETTETYIVDIPVMGVVYREMTAEEEAEYASQEVPTPSPTAEDRIAELEAALAALLGGVTE